MFLLLKKGWFLQINSHKSGSILIELLHNIFVQCINPFWCKFIRKCFFVPLPFGACGRTYKYTWYPIYWYNEVMKGYLQTSFLVYSDLVLRVNLQTYLHLLLTTNFSFWKFQPINPCKTNIQATKWVIQSKLDISEACLFQVWVPLLDSQQEMKSKIYPIFIFVTSSRE